MLLLAFFLVLGHLFGFSLAMSSQNNQILGAKHYFDVDDDFESLDPAIQFINASLPAILTALGITVSTKVGDTGGQEYAFTEDELIVASSLGIGGGKPFRMPKPLNWTIPDLDMKLIYIAPGSFEMGSK